MWKKIEDIKDLDITECLADNCVNDKGGEFWKNFDKLVNEGKISEAMSNSNIYTEKNMVCYWMK